VERLGVRMGGDSSADLGGGELMLTYMARSRNRSKSRSCTMSRPISYEEATCKE